MAISPAEIRALQFSTVKRGGYDQREVEAFRTSAADSLETALQESTAMEARARAAVARLQELSQQPAAAEAAHDAGEEHAAAEDQPTASAAADDAVPAKPRVIAPDESETISRTLLLAQRTADTAIAEAEATAADRIAEAEAEAARLIESAKAESRRAGEAERVRVEGEVQALLARRDFLESDVDQLEQHLQAQRERITDVVAELTSLTGRVANGLGPMRRPQLSASDHSGEQDRPADADLPSDDAASDEPALGVAAVDGAAVDMVGVDGAAVASGADDAIADAPGDDDIDVSSLIDETREAGDTTSPVDRPAVGEHDLFSQDDDR